MEGRVKTSEVGRRLRLVLTLADPKLLAAVAHEGAIKPKNNEKYRKILEQRRLESEQTRR